MSLTPVDITDPTELVARQQRLLDVYGALLTEHQREACRLHLDEDWSFAELAEELGCSRSAAHDLVRRALVQLEHYESKLGHAAELARRDAVEEELRARLADVARAGSHNGLAEPAIRASHTLLSAPEIAAQKVLAAPGRASRKTPAEPGLASPKVLPEPAVRASHTLLPAPEIAAPKVLAEPDIRAPKARRDPATAPRAEGAPPPAHPHV